MGDMRERHRDDGGGSSILRIILRFIANAIVLMVVSFFVPGFAVAGFWPAIIAAVIISIIDYVIEAAFGFDASPTGRGLSGFVVAAIIIYLTQFFVAGVSVSILGAIIAAAVIGVINLIIPSKIF